MTGKLARIKIILGILLASTPALAQQLPFSLPANSVVGRTNVTGNSGDAYAIPFSQLAALLSTYGLVQAPPSGVQGHVVVFGSLPGQLVDGGGVYTDTTNASNITSGTLAAGRMPALTGDVTSSVGTVSTSLATVNSNVGTFGSSTQCPTVTVNAKGLITAASQAACASGGSPGGTSGQIQFNSTGSFGGFTASGDLTVNTGTGVFTLGTVNANVGSFGSATQCLTVTNNAKGLTTAIAAVTCTPAIGSITGLGTGVSTAAAANLSAAGGLTTTIASGATALGTGAIASGACATAITATATNTATTDVLTASFNSDPTAVTGYIPATAGMLTIIVYPTANTANFKVCNNTGSSITPGAITLNWRVVR